MPMPKVSACGTLGSCPTGRMSRLGAPGGSLAVRRPFRLGRTPQAQPVWAADPGGRTTEAKSATDH